MDKANNPILACRSCGALVMFQRTAKGRNCPFDVDPKTREVTDVSHFKTCPDGLRWSRSHGRGGRLRGGRDG